MAVSKHNLIKISMYQMDQVIGKETVIKKEISYKELVELITEVPSINRVSIGNKKMNITTKIISGEATLYDWHKDKIAGL